MQVSFTYLATREAYMSMGQASGSPGHYVVRWILNQNAQGLMEYALIIVLVAIIVLVVLAILGPGVGNLFSNVVSNI
jgi:pilus assembly protein Flp/PilA